MNAAQLMVTVGANTAAAEQGIMGFSRLIGPGGVLALGALGAAAAVAGIGIASTKMAATFESDTLTLVTGAGLAQKDLGKVRDGILQMARDTGTSTKQLTDGMFMISSAGFKTSQALDILRVAAEGAKVGAADLGTTADALTTILKDYPDVTGGATGAMNLLIDTVAHGKTHMEDLAGSLSTILPTANAAGVGLNGVMAAMATMTGEGVHADQAATFLRQTLLMLNAPSDKARKTLESVGLTTDQVAAEMKKNLPAALQMITDAVGKHFPKGSAEYVAAIKDIVGGTRTVQGILDLTGKHMGDFQHNLQTLTGDVKKHTGAVTGWALVQQTANQRWDVLKQTVETLMIQLGQHFLPLASKLADIISHGLNGAVKDLTGQLNIVTHSGDAVSEVFGRHLHGSVTQVHDTMSKQFNPTVQALANLFTRDVQPAAKQVGHFFETVIVPILHTLGEVITRNVLPVVENLAHIILTKWLPPLMRIYGDILPVLNPLLRMFGWIFQNIIGPALGATGDIIGHILDLIANLTDAISKFFQNPAVQKFFSTLGNGIGNQFNNLGTSTSKALANMGIPGFAIGGVMSHPGLAMVGENGPELVHLPGGARITPMTGVSGHDLAPISGFGASGHTTTIVVQLQADGKRLAQVVVPHIHERIRLATGKRSM